MLWSAVVSTFNTLGRIPADCPRSFCGEQKNPWLRRTSEGTKTTEPAQCFVSLKMSSLIIFGFGKFRSQNVILHLYTCSLQMDKDYKEITAISFK